MTTAIEQTLETYGIENWGAGYFDVNRKGNLIVRPVEGDPRSADLKEIIDDLAKRGITAPVLLRFPQLVAAQVRKLQRAFSRSIREFEYQGAHMCVYPMKVNQQRSVVEEYLREGSRYDFGLEAGSKPELYAALALEQPGDSLLVLNGFKDEEFIELAFAGAKVGKKVVIVIEKLNELDHVLNVAERHEGAMPMLGMRVKLYSKGSGRWEKSGGEAAKFGLTTTELLEVIRRLEEAGRMDMLKLLHFHIGSQLTDIKRIKNAMKEAARVYAKVYQMKVPIDSARRRRRYGSRLRRIENRVRFVGELHGAGVCQRRHLHDQAGLRRRKRSAPDDHPGVGPLSLPRITRSSSQTCSTKSKPSSKTSRRSRSTKTIRRS